MQLLNAHERKTPVDADANASKKNLSHHPVTLF